jgi:cytochrome c2
MFDLKLRKYKKNPFLGNMECCGFPMKTKIKKNGQKVAKCRRCGDVKKVEKGSVGPGLWASVEQAKAEYEEALKKALTAKYDVLFNYKPSRRSPFRVWP